MKKIISAIFIILTLQSVNAFSQKFFLQADIGHYFPVGGQTFGTNVSQENGKSPVNGSLGAGRVMEFGVGYLFSKTIGLDINMGTLHLSKNKAAGTSASTVQSSTTDSTENYAIGFSSSCTFINPSFVIRGGIGKRVAPYGKMGVFIGFNNKSTLNYTEAITNKNYQHSGNDYAFNKTETITYHGNNAYGITSSLGLDFIFSKNRDIAMFIEASIRVAQWTPSKEDSETNSTMHINDSYGYPVSGNVSDSKESINLVKDLPVAYSGTDQISQLISLNGVGLKVGVKLFILRKKLTEVKGQ